MKSAIFESINDRSNIANAYMRMVNEANEELQNRYNDISALYEGNDHPLCIYDKDGDKVIDLFDIESNYKEPSYYEKGFGDYYIALAFDKYGLDELYKKLIEYDSNLYIPPERAVSLEDGFLSTIGDVERAIEQIGRECEENLHKDDVEVAIPEWAAVYFENADDSGLTEEDKKLVDDYFDKITSQGYKLAYDGENLGFCPHPEFGPADDCVKYYLIKKNGTTAEQNEVEESVEDGWFDEYGNMIKTLPEECINDCTVPGKDAYGSCKYWVKELDFANGLDIPLAKGYLKWTGGWDDDEIASLNDEETAIKILWILANDAKEGMDVLSIGDGGRFDDGSSNPTEKDGVKNEMLNQSDIDKLKKKNPKLKDISEER